MTVIYEGGEKLAALSRALNKAGEKTLAKELDAGFRTPLQELIPILKVSQFHVMPKGGGAAAAIQGRTFFKVRKVGTGTRPGMRLVANQKGRIQRQDRGVLRHPVFADADKPREEWKWVNQAIEPGWFTDPTKAASEGIRLRQEQALRNVVRQIEIDMGG